MDSFSIKCAVILLFFVSSLEAKTVHPVRHPIADQALCAKITDILAIIERLKRKGASRADLEKDLSPIGGLWNPANAGYAFIACPYIVVDVTFQMKKGKGETSPDDIITGISKPYIEYPPID